MSFCLPLSGFRWMTEHEISNFSVARDVKDRAGPGYILEVTLEYPKELHLKHNSFPLAPEQLNITSDDLSPYASDCLAQLKGDKKYSATKLSASFRDRKNYVLHGMNLKLYLKHGLKLIKIHKGITFHQEKFLEPYISMCTKKRAESKTKSQSNLFKYLSNSLYGKMIEGTGSRTDCKFNTSKERAMTNFANPLYKSTVVCGEDLSISFHHKREVFMKQSWAVGFSILELSKYVMQKLMYEVIKPRFNDQVMVLMTDTDSWLFRAPAKNPDEIFEKISDVMDFSNYDESHHLFDGSRKNMLGFLKNEVPKTSIKKFVGLRSKTYAFLTEKEKMESRAKGVKKSYKKKIPFSAFKKCLDNVCKVKTRQVGIMSKNHQNMLIENEKVAFSSFDDKRYLLCPLHSVPYGSFLIEYYKVTKKCYFCINPSIIM